MVNDTMDALGWLRKQLDGGENDLLGEITLAAVSVMAAFAVATRSTAAPCVRSPLRCLRESVTYR